MAADIVVQIGAEFRELRNAVEGIEKGFTGLAGRIKSLFTDIVSAYITRSLIKARAEFEDFVRQIMLFTPETTQQTQAAIERFVLDITAATRYSSTEIANAYRIYVRMFGLSAQEAFAALAHGAEILQVQPEILVRGLYKAANALGFLGQNAEENAKRLLVLAAVVDRLRSRTPFEASEILEALGGRQIAALRSANQSLKTIIELIEQLAARGFRLAEIEAAFEGFIRAIANASKSGEIQAAWRAIGIELFPRGELIQLTDLFDQLRQRLEGLSTAQKLAILQQLGFERSSRLAALALLDQREAITQANIAQANFVESFASKWRTISSQWKGLFSTIEVTMLNLGKTLVVLTPIFSAIAGLLLGVTSVIQTFSSNTIKMVAALTIAIAIAPRVVAAIRAIYVALKALSIAAIVTQLVSNLPMALAKLAAVGVITAGVLWAISEAEKAVNSQLEEMERRVQEEYRAAAEQQLDILNQQKQGFNELREQIEDTAEASQQLAREMFGAQAPIVLDVIGKVKSNAKDITDIQEAIKSIEQLYNIAKLREEERVGVPSLWQYEIGEHFLTRRELLKAYDELHDRLDKLAGGINENIRALELEISVLQRGGDELDIQAEKYREIRKQLGLSTEIVDRWLELERQKKRILDEQQRLSRIREELYPEREFAQELQQIEQFWRRGLLTRQEVRRWIQMQRERLIQEPTKALPEAIQIGTSAAYSLINRVAARDPSILAARTTAHNTSVMVRQLDALLKRVEGVL